MGTTGHDEARPRDTWVPRTKLVRPEVAADAVIDPTLLASVARAVSGTPVTLVSAQPGAGKTTLVSAALRHADIPVAWAHPGPPTLARAAPGRRGQRVR